MVRDTWVTVLSTVNLLIILWDAYYIYLFFGQSFPPIRLAAPTPPLQSGIGAGGDPQRV